LRTRTTLERLSVLAPDTAIGAISHQGLRLLANFVRMSAYGGLRLALHDIGFVSVPKLVDADDTT
jgi:hypothetical protein